MIRGDGGWRFCDYTAELRPCGTMFLRKRNETGRSNIADATELKGAYGVGISNNGVGDGTWKHL